MKQTLAFLLVICQGLAYGKSGEEDGNKIYSPIMQVAYFKLGNITIPLKTYQYGSRKDIVMIHLHGNEKTSLLAGMKWLKANGGLLIKIENGDVRNIAFGIDTAAFQFDPNHIFSKQGITNDFANNKYQLQKAITETQKFARKILSLIPANPSVVVALHNNFNGDYSIDSYLKGHERASDAAKVFKNPSQDADDICLTTDATLFQQLSSEGFNTILQHATTVKKDGSLSVYFQEKKIRYLNCETEHDKQVQYYQMLSSAMKYIERRNNNERLIAYKCPDSLGLIQKGVGIYNDSIYKGEIKSAYRSKDGTMVSGKFSWPLKMPVNETITLLTAAGINGNLILGIQSMMGKLIKTGEQKVNLKLDTVAPTPQNPVEELIDSTVIF